MKYLLGADIGTSSMKTSVFTLEGEEVACSTIEYGLQYVKCVGVEQNPEDWWQAFRFTLADIREKSEVDTRDIIGIGVSSQSWAVIPVDSKGTVLSPAMIWMDRRATEEAEWLGTRIGDGIREIRVDPSYIVPKVLWLKRHAFDIYDGARHLLQVSGYMNYRLSGVVATDVSQEDPLQIYIKNGSQFASIEDYYDSIGVDQTKIPSSRFSHEVIGEVCRNAAEETGLRYGTPIIAGAMDTSATALGMNITEHGQSFHVAGQAGAIGVCSAEPRFDPRVCIHNHVISGRWLVAGVMVATGASMRWLRDLLQHDKVGESESCSIEAFESISEGAARVPPGSRGLVFLPYMMGERTPVWDCHARGILFGLSLGTGREELARSIMEGTSYALRDNIEVLESLGIRIGKVVCAGGAVKSRIWNQIKADITKKQLVSIGGDVCAARGAAMLAAKGIGLPVGFAQGQIRELESYLPNDKYFERYDCLYGIYKRLYLNARSDYEELARVERSQ